MSRSGRLIKLLETLEGPRLRTIDELVDRFEVSRRTVYRDLAELEGWRIPVHREGGRYRIPKGATLGPLDLTSRERALLQIALDQPAIRGQRPLRRIAQRLEAKIDAASRAPVHETEALALTGPERSGPAAEATLEELEAAARRHQAVEIDYRSLSGRSRRWRGVDPYRLFHRDGAWYLAGHCHEHGELRSFRLDRIAGVRTLPRAFDPPAGFDLDGYLAGAWSVVRGDGRYPIVLEADADLAPLFEHSRLHPGQELRRRDDGVIELRVTLSHLDEIARWVVGFGGRVRVVGPEELRGRVVELAEGVVAGHGRPGLEGRSRPLRAE